MLIRNETSEDAASIQSVLTAAFPTDAEARLVNALRASSNLTLSLVAEQQGTIVGHIAFSPVMLVVDTGPTAWASVWRRWPFRPPANGKESPANSSKQAWPSVRRSANRCASCWASPPTTSDLGFARRPTGGLKTSTASMRSSWRLNFATKQSPPTAGSFATVRSSPICNLAELLPVSAIPCAIQPITG